MSIKIFHIIPLLGLLSACDGNKVAEICDDGKDNDGNELADCDDAACSDDSACIDADGDGYPVSTDCDDNEAAAYPDATETCDEIDNNCDGTIDEGVTSTYYSDSDADSFGDPMSSLEACTVPSGYVADNTDCDDESDGNFPGADEVCDGIDNNCNDSIDDAPIDPVEFFLDADGDGYGLDFETTEACEAPSGYADKGGDCDDANNVSFPGADEICDTLDNDCDLEIDEEPIDGQNYYADNDSDGFGDLTTEAAFCQMPSGYVENGDDCDDTTNSANPDAPEICDGIDNDCDTSIDDDDSSLISASTTSWYSDVDGDGYGLTSDMIEACDMPSGYVALDGDCDDSEPVAYPGGPELCDSIDNDCDGNIDDKPTDGSIFYYDSDSDGYGQDGLIYISCSLPVGYSVSAGDCDDTSDVVNPGENELCDGVDNNCSGDENDASDALTFYADSDGDTFGNPQMDFNSCQAPPGYVSDFTDCDDGDDTVYVGAEEICDGIDNDCDTVVDQADSDFDPINLIDFYIDADGDGYGDDLTLTQSCVQPSGYVMVGGDCDDSIADLDGDNVPDGYITNPVSAEVWYDGIDSNCDGLSDYDADLDGDDSDQWGGNDCDDTNSFQNGQDYDLDFVSSCDGDCDDNDVYTYPGAGYNEAPPLDVECLTDFDGDGYAAIQSSCFTLEVVDTGSFWDLSEISILLNGQFAYSYTNLGGGSELYDFCLDPGLVEMSYVCNSTYDCAAHTFYLYDENGVELYSDGLNVTGLQPANGVFFAETLGSGNDCDDSDANIGPTDNDNDGSSECANDCDDNDPLLDGLDADGDGFSTCDGDCDETTDDLDNDGVPDGALINPSVPEIYGDGIDQNCDGLSDYDSDGDGDDSINDGGTDCDDTDPSIEGLDTDNDGITTCDGDCDDLDEFTFPGAAELESTTDCLTDVDDDGYSPALGTNCFTVEMQDSYGDGWNGAALNIYLDGFPVDSGLGSGSYTNHIAGAFYFDTGYSSNAAFCVDGGSILELEYLGGSFETENTYQLLDEAGNILFQDGASPLIGFAYTYNLPSSGMDCDDNDPLVSVVDADGDGFMACANDCDDGDDTLTPLDEDGDGFSTCQGDCNDDPSDPTSTNINPDIVENYYNGVDENCDGLSDYDADMDGEDDLSAPNGLGTDCDDTNGSVGLLIPEVCDLIDNDCDGLVDDDDTIATEDLNMWYADSDGDSFGDASISLSQCIEPSGYVMDDQDCNDSDNTINPDVIEVYYDGVDSNCDEMSDYDSDMDGEDSDQWGGTDCDDSNYDLSNTDMDLDTWTTCDGDCDDNDIYTFPGSAELDSISECLTDFDGDGYGALVDSCFTLDLVDTGAYWDNASLTISVNGVEVDSLTNLGGGVETYDVCYDSGMVNFNYTCASTYDCIAHTIYIYDATGTLLYQDGAEITGLEPLQGDFLTSYSSDLATDCDDNDITIGATDNDLDGYVDCAGDCDPNDPLALGEELCFDGFDNDCDGLADCDDSGCDEVCTEFYCDDNIDNDNNGFSDCDDSQCEFDPSCFEYECGDSVDDDLDSLTDCDDPDCDGSLDCMELVCDDGIDDENDGLADCDDPDCINDIYCFDYCVSSVDNDGDGIWDADLQSVTGNSVVSGTNIGAGDDFQGSCSSGLGGEDVVYKWTSPGSGTYSFSTLGSDYDTVIYITESCIGDELDCNDDEDYVSSVYTSVVDTFVASGETVIIVIDAYEVTETGNFMLNILPSYEPDCGDGIDNDNDGDIDCDDSDCAFDAFCAATTCPNFDVGSQVGTPLVVGNNVNSSDQTQGSCHSSGGFDFSFLWTAPDDGCLEFDTDGTTYDTSIYILDSCGGAELDCNDDSIFGLQSYLNYDVVAGEDYILVVDGYSSTSSGDYNLNVEFSSGVVCQ